MPREGEEEPSVKAVDVVMPAPLEVLDSTAAVALLLEADYPKDEERDKKRVKFSREVLMPYYEKMVEEKGIKTKMSIWSDNTGYVVAFWEFETMEDFAQMWNDERWQQILARWARLVDNARIRLLRPSFYIPEDLK